MDKVKIFLTIFVAAVLCLSDSNATPGTITGDVNNDGILGLEDAIYVLQALSGSRQIIPHYPDVAINAPSQGSVFKFGTSITFAGSSVDVEDGSLSGNAMVWASSLDGQIGTGESISRSNLSVGMHTITLTATDNGSLAKSAAVTIEVRANLDLKIFVTSTGHVGDFADDPLLTGNNAIEKADFFCNHAANKPDSKAYKALLIDGIHRDAVNNIDWVLLPNNTYFRPSGLEIGTTSASAIFPTIYQNLTNSIDDRHGYEVDDPNINYAWVGVGNVSNFSALQQNCSNWSSSSGYGKGALFIYKDEKAFLESNVSVPCSGHRKLYCVEQP
jgi:hypothetical protein